MAIFTKAIEEMDSTNRSTYGPLSFKRYNEEQNLITRGTAPHISIQSIGNLKRELRENKIMVFRLGRRPDDNNTYFGLSRCVENFHDYFLIDEKIFETLEPELFLPTASARELYVFNLLPNSTETSLVNIAVATGLLNEALKIDKSHIPSVPATGKSIYTFKVRPHNDYDVVWDHFQGQVEIDAMFTARRDGKETLFIIEAKYDTNLDSLAKYKLLYPYLAIKSTVPKYLEIVLVYIRAIKKNDGVHFYIAECVINDDDKECPSMNSLEVNKPSYYLLGGLSIT